MPAYWIAHVDVTDEALYGEYAKIATEAIAAHGGEFLARGGRYKQLEGKDRARNVVAVFPTFEDAVAVEQAVVKDGNAGLLGGYELAVEPADGHGIYSRGWKTSRSWP